VLCLTGRNSCAAVVKRVAVCVAAQRMLAVFGSWYAARAVAEGAAPALEKTVPYASRGMRGAPAAKSVGAPKSCRDRECGGGWRRHVRHQARNRSAMRRWNS